MARLLAEHGRTQRCALPGCNKLVHFDIADPRRHNNYCGQHHARMSHASAAHAVDPSTSARPPRPHAKSNHKWFVLTPAMRACACAFCSQRHLDSDCPTNRPCPKCDRHHPNRDCPRRPPPPSAAALTLPPDGIPGAAAAVAPPPGLHLLDHGPDAVTAAPPAHPPALLPRGRPWLPGGDAVPDALLPAKEAIESRDAHVAQTYDARRPLFGWERQRSPPQAAHHSHRRQQRVVHRSSKKNAALHSSKLTPSNLGCALLVITTTISCALSRTKRNLSLCVTPAMTPAGHHLHPRRRLPALAIYSTTLRPPFLSTQKTTSMLTVSCSPARPFRLRPRGPLPTDSTARFGTFCTRHGTKRCTPSTAMVSTSTTYFYWLLSLPSATASLSSASIC